MKPNNLPWRRLLFLLLAIILLIWVARTISLRDTLAALTQLGPGDILLLALVNLAILSTFAGRWWLLLRVQGEHVPYWRLLAYRVTAFSISYFTPGAHFGGEPYQIYTVSRWHGVTTPVSIAAVTLDKLLEMLINFAVLVAGVLVLLTLRGGFSLLVEGQLILYTTLLLALPCAFLLALWLGYHPISAMVKLTGHLLRRPFTQSHWAQALYHSEEQAIWLCHTHPRVVGMAFLISILTWVGILGEFWLLTDMLGLYLTPLQVLTSLVAARIAILLPVPAGLGTLEAGQVLAMQMVGADPSAGIAIAVVIRARDLILGFAGLALGGAHLWQNTGIIKLPGASQPQPPKMPAPQINTPDAPAPVSDVSQSAGQP